MICEKNEIDAEIEKTENAILEEWKKQWESYTDCDKSDKGRLFLQWFIAAYKKTELESDRNKKYNFLFKIAYLLIVFCIIIFWFIYIGKFILKSISSSQIIGCVLVLLSMLLLVTVISKLINIKKFQETWVRFSGLKTNMLQEMTKFIYSMSPYNTENKRYDFVLQILKIVEENSKKFSDNMKNEEPLLSLKEIVSMIIGNSK